MSKKIYVGNLSFSTNDQSLGAAFGAFGTVVSAKVILDKETQRSRGFGFVEMSTEAEAQAAIAGMNGKDLDGREVKASEALEKKKN